MTPRIRLSVRRVLFTLLALLMIALPLLPLGFSPSRWAMPDLFFALTISWVIRDKHSAPLILVAGLALLADAILMRPLGLWAVLVVITSELARMNDRFIRDGGIIAEMLFFWVTAISMVIIQNIFLFLTFSNSYPVDRLVQFVMLSLIIYPFIAAILHYVLRIRGEISKNLPDRLGKVG